MKRPPEGGYPGLENSFLYLLGGSSPNGMTFAPFHVPIIAPPVSQKSSGFLSDGWNPTWTNEPSHVIPTAWSG